MNRYETTVTLTLTTTAKDEEAARRAFCKIEDRLLRHVEVRHLESDCMEMDL